jgi:hypothetical protein
VTNGVDKIVSYDIVTGVVEVLEESFTAKHKNSFNGRVIASAVLEGQFIGARQRWSVKLDNTDWTSQSTSDGIGAGFEDLLASPGGYVDGIMGTFPLTDDVA